MRYVSPYDAVWNVRLDYDVDCTYHECTRCGHAHYGQDAPKECEDCGLTADDAHTPFLRDRYDHDLGQWYWNEFTGEIKEVLIRAFPSLYPSEARVGRDNHAILENSHAYIGITDVDYGRVEIWCVPKEYDSNGYGWEVHGLHAQWAKSIGKRAERLLKPLSRSTESDWRIAA